MDYVRFPALRALAAQLAALPLAYLLVFLFAAVFGWKFPLLLIAVLQGGIAALLSRYLGMMVWWLPIQFLFVPALVAALSFEIAPSWFLLGFLLLLAVYWSVFRTQVPLYLSSRAAWRALAGVLPPKPDVRLIDLGSGLGGLLGFLNDARPHGHFVGIEAAPLPFALGWLRLRGKNCDMRYGSFWRCDLSRYDVVYAYLSPAPMAELWRKVSAEMQPGSLFVSNTFAVPGVMPTETVQIDDFHASTLYIYQLKPAQS
ncbi:MAG: class I SAM-dependent methyltransferase [Sulfuricellaceae bacterium]